MQRNVMESGESGRRFQNWPPQRIEGSAARIGAVSSRFTRFTGEQPLGRPPTPGNRGFFYEKHKPPER